jgi:hypothetical protein
MTIDELKQLQASGEFHHATYRDIGKCWEGLYIYRRGPNGFRGFTLAGSFNNYHRARNAECEAAMDLIKGLHVGSYGNG